MKLSKIAKILGIECSKEMEINAINSLDMATEGQISYCEGVGHKEFLKKTKASAVLIQKELVEFLPKGSIALICGNPHLAFAKLSRYFSKPYFDEKGKNHIAPSVTIMEGAVIGKNVTIKENTTIMPGVVIGDSVTIGSDCIIHPNVVIYRDSIIGDRCHLLANSVIGSDGFGYAHDELGRHIKIYHNGNVVLEDDVEIGACTTIDRAVFGSTIIKKGTKIDNLVQVGHNCELGENCIIVSQVGLAGSSILGRNVVMGGQSGTKGHISIGDFAQIAARGGVSKNLEGNKLYAGYPLLELKEWFKLNAKISRFFSKDRQ